ncbi:MAG: NAD(P)-dependent oxidoreductase [Candidatus Pelagibacterales bacterium]|jgi:3-hydroxyisobutyrate dehydrogenase|tara:strand:+ start:667 stop:1530 length:864 start_codon:yes stop_codon:yes gene_type:complete
MHKILFIGLGTMGYPMAGHLSKINEVTVYNRTVSKSQKWIKEHNGKFISKLSEIEERFDFVISCIGNDNDLIEITTSKNGCFKNLNRDSIFIDHSTVSPKLVKKISEDAEKVGIKFLDAPISGGEAGAINGALSIMIGGKLKTYNDSEELLQAYGKKIKFMGQSGSGQLTKIINQICIAGLVQGLAEAVHFMKKTDLSADDVLDVISGGAAQSWQLDNRLKTMSEDKFNFGFAVDLMRKDLGIAFDQAKDFGINLDVTKIVDQYYLELQKMGHNKLDTSSLVKRLTE